MRQSRIAIVLGSMLVAAVGLLIVDRTDLDPLIGLGLVLGLLLGYAGLTVPAVLASSAGRTASEDAVLRSLLKRDETLRLEARGLARIGLENPVRRYTKRGFDVIASALLLIFLAPVMLVIAVALKIESRGPVFFRRVVFGRGGGTFEQIKFRTMYDEADLRMRMDADADGASEGAVFRIRRDPRLTRVGSLLRRYFLDELPQLFNVLKGEMSLVGPPPLENEYRALRGLFQLARPGVTGVWRTLDDVEVTAPDLARAELVYLVNRSVWTDLKLCTVGRHAMRRRAITTMWTLAVEDREAGVESGPEEILLVGAEERAQLPLVESELAPKRSIG